MGHKTTVNRPKYLLTFELKTGNHWFTETYTSLEQMNKTLASHSPNFAYNVLKYEFNGTDFVNIP